MSEESPAKEVLRGYFQFVWGKLLSCEQTSQTRGATRSSVLHANLDDLFACFDEVLRNSQMEGDRAWREVESMPNGTSRQRFSTVEGKLQSFGCIWVKYGVQEQCKMVFHDSGDQETRVSTTFNRHNTYMQEATLDQENWKPIGLLHNVPTEGCLTICAACGLCIMPLSKQLTSPRPRRPARMTKGSRGSTPAPACS